MDAAPERRARRSFTTKPPPPDGHPSGWPSPAGLPLEGNVRGPALASRGDAAQGLAEAEVVVEGEYRTQVQTHCCMEPHAIVADWRGDGLTVYMSTQFTAGVRERAGAGVRPAARQACASSSTAWAAASARSRRSAITAASRSRCRGRPARRCASRSTGTRSKSTPATGRRPGSACASARSRDGTLTAISLRKLRHGRRRGSAPASAISPRRSTPARTSSPRSTTSSSTPGRACAMRGPGNTPGAFALEQAIDELAEKLGLDPLALRDRIDPSPVAARGAAARRRSGSAGSGGHAPGADPGPVKRGLGVAQSLWGANVQTHSSCEVAGDARRRGRGPVERAGHRHRHRHGDGADRRRGASGCGREDIAVRIGDTEFPRRAALLRQPHHRLDHAAGARRRVARPAGAVRARRRSTLNAGADDLVARERAHRGPRRPEPKLRLSRGGVRMSVDRISAIASRSDDYGGFRRRMADAALAEQDLGGVQFAEVAVDTETGIVRVERVVAAQDCGRPMNPLLIESQVQGGVLMGLSYALLRGAHSRRRDRAHGQPQSRTIQARRSPRDAGDRRRAAGELPAPTAPPTPTASPSRPTSPPRRRSPMRSTMRSACAFAPCR